ncbi:hypothetical protein EXS61_01900 [Candidatus Parcubacteria bacterium]|nr:hypothetical protein [Candidatus Parcubacteria bacterium]
MTPRNRAEAPISKKLSFIVKTFSLTEKSIFFLFSAVFVFTGLSILWGVNTHFLVDVPSRGGRLTEGIVGSPRYINPLLAVSDADEDVTSLIYSGLLKVSPEGNLINDLAKDYSISTDGLEYTFTLKDDISFQDGTSVTASDVEFTAKKAQDIVLKSPKRINWDGVTIQKINDKQIKFILKYPYSPFIENLTMGILPEHVWKNLDADQFSASLFNTEPIGSGPYKVSKIKRNSGGVPIYYKLTSFSDYALGEPYIGVLALNFYTNDDSAIEAYQNGDIESIGGVSPQKIGEMIRGESVVKQASLQRVFGIFFNQSHAPVLLNKEVRTALALVVDKDKIVADVLQGYGTSIDGPLPFRGYMETSATSTLDILTNTDRAIALLTKNGWRLNDKTGIMEKTVKKVTTTLSFSISTSDAPELKATAQILQDEWVKIGAKVDIKVFETSDLNQNIIRPRKYDALLFGEIIRRGFDLYPFWHSSQRNDPGLNVALYVNSKADKLLEEMRTTTDIEIKNNDFSSFAKLISDDIPAIFTYSPNFTYLVPLKIQNIKLGNTITPNERFMNINEWYVETNKVWKIFVKDNE